MYLKCSQLKNRTKSNPSPRLNFKVASQELFYSMVEYFTQYNYTRFKHRRIPKVFDQLIVANYSKPMDSGWLSHSCSILNPFL